MGLGLRFGTALKRSWWQLNGPDIRERFSAIARSGEKYMQSHGLCIVFRSHVTEGRLEVFLHPSEEPVRFFEDESYLVVEARTSSAGPGYHAFLVEWLDELAQAGRFSWQVDLGDGVFCDETGYVTHRDFSALQHAMADQFKAVAKYVLEAEADNIKHFNLSLPAGFEVQGEYFAVTTLGFRNRDFFEHFVPERFCLWWNRGLDAKTLANMAASKMWVDITWHPPVNDEEHRDLTIVKVLSARARELDPQIALPEEALRDVDTVLAGVELKNIEQDEIGFRRHPMRWFLTGDWSIALPGYFYQRFDPDNGQMSIWYGDRTVHVTTFDFTPAVLELQWPSSRDGEAEHLRFEDDALRCVATLRRHQEGEISGWLLQAVCNSFSSAALVSILFMDEKDVKWAEAVLRTLQVRLPKAKADQKGVSVH